MSFSLSFLEARSSSHVSANTLSFLYLGAALKIIAAALEFKRWPFSLAAPHKVCVVQVTVDAQTVLTVRSWWPGSLSSDDVAQNGARIGIRHAEQWVAENRSTCAELQITPQHARHVIHTYLTKPIQEPASQCAVCLESLEEHHCCLDSAIAGAVNAEVVCLASCGHQFHADCLTDWFSRSSRLQCPLCRCDHAHLVPSLVLPRSHETRPNLVITSLTVEQRTSARPRQGRS